jgi:recombination protein RecT
MSQLIRLDDRAKTLESVFKQNMGALSKVVPRTMGDPSRLLRIAYNNVAYDTALLECSATPQGMASIFGGVMECLKLGLQIGGPMQEAWLIPFKQKGIPIATVIIGYQGYRNILDRGKSVIDLHPVSVYEGDEFDFELGSRPFVKHKPKLGDRGKLIAVYAVAHLPRGGIQIEVMGKEEVDQHRAKSRASGAGPWVDFYDAMALKTVVRKISKYLPKSSEILARALDLDDRADRGVDQNVDIEGLVFDLSVPAGGMKQVGGTKLDELKKSLPAGGPSKARAEGDGLGGSSEDIAEQHRTSRDATDEEIQRANETRPAQNGDPEAERIAREREEIARKMKEFEAKEAPARAPMAEPVPSMPAMGLVTDTMKPVGNPLFDDPLELNKPIGKEEAARLLEKIRGPKK